MMLPAIGWCSEFAESSISTVSNTQTNPGQGSFGHFLHSVFSEIGFSSNHPKLDQYWNPGWLGDLPVEETSMLSRQKITWIVLNGKILLTWSKLDFGYPDDFGNSRAYNGPHRAEPVKIEHWTAFERSHFANTTHWMPDPVPGKNRPNENRVWKIVLLDSSTRVGASCSSHVRRRRRQRGRSRTFFAGLRWSFRPLMVR